MSLHGVVLLFTLDGKFRQMGKYVIQTSVFITIQFYILNEIYCHFFMSRNETFINILRH